MRFYLCLAAIFALVVWQSYSLLQDYPQGEQSKHWPTTTGVVTGKEAIMLPIKGSPPSYEAKINYTYKVGGSEFHGNRISFPNPIVRQTCAQPAPLFKEYPLGKSVSVYYDPSAPQKSCLVTGYVRDIGNQITILIFFILAGVAAIYLRSPFKRFFGR